MSDKSGLDLNNITLLKLEGSHWIGDENLRLVKALIHIVTNLGWLMGGGVRSPDGRQDVQLSFLVYKKNEEDFTAEDVAGFSAKLAELARQFNCSMQGQPRFVDIDSDQN